MLRGIRNASSNWLGKTLMTIVMGLLIVAFGIWGIADIFHGFGQSALATVGGTEISTEQFRQIYNDRLQQIGRQFGRPLPPDQVRALGLDRQILQQVIAEAALDEDAQRKGLKVSDEEIGRQIKSDPNFKGANNAFDAARFAGLIRQLGYTEQRYVAEQRNMALRRQIVGTMTAGVEPSKTLLEALNRFQNEQRTIDYVKLGAAQAGTIDPPTADQLSGYFDAHKVQFRAPEYRKVAFVVLTPEEVAKWTAVSDDDARKIYEERKDKLSTPERRQLRQIMFPSVTDAQAAREKIAGGASFDDIARERGLATSDIDLGTISKAEIIDPAIANAAFSINSDEVSQPTQGRFGVALIKVGRIEPGNQPTYESVAEKLKRDVALDRARAEINNLHNKMEDERGGGASVVEAAKKVGLSAVTIEATDRSGRAPDGKPVSGIPQGVDLIAQAFASDVGVDNDTLQLGNNGFIWFDVIGVTPSRDRTLDEVKDKVEARWREDQISSRLMTKATDTIRKLEQGGKLADEAASLGLKVESASAIKRDATTTALPAAVVAAVCRAAKDAAGQAPGAGNDEWFIFRVTDVKVPTLDLASDETKKLREGVQRGLSDEYIGQYIVKLEAEIGTKINQAAVAQITGASSNF
ncbi:PpiC-type peptidyl-prolyl cis-trans isomerase [Nitrobacter winogradskyi Nb-255]|uniref:Parvulin-like PPIase n=1 Tax=Nitrobacter winogradskyi (strain ATCC 25391 / DSM 10237 / CIP 104748 / NCIMB 11846 / Nb-255) TaxID=323098 RepID=Q3SRJ5_NITWN|nr:peptidylprolyl isomerase [Nitrobacter winogradskyi]ABA05096.1 PpiC-type peptidyl-prolyl cis-trans isomerase [Nitrobacter winogradskyi Nb-255]